MRHIFDSASSMTASNLQRAYDDDEYAFWLVRDAMEMFRGVTVLARYELGAFHDQKVSIPASWSQATANSTVGPRY